MGKVIVIVAVAENGGIGKSNDLLFHLPDDMKFFKTTTTGNIVVTGRKNFESIPEKFRPLPNRENIVISRNNSYSAPCLVYSDLSKCLSDFKNDIRDIYIIGGGEIYKEVLRLNLVDELLITHVSATVEADTFFPIEFLNNLQSETVLKKESDDKHAFGFEIKKYRTTI